MARKGSSFATWAIVRYGVCTKHKTRVGEFTGLCYQCHHDDLVRSGFHRQPERSSTDG